MKRAPRSRQRHDLYAKYHDYDSEISDLLGECGMKLKNRHRWLLEVLKYIDSYVRDNQLWHMSYAVSEAFAAARTEIAFDYSDESNVIVFDPRCVKY